jgi:predicted transcriptional regulator
MSQVIPSYTKRVLGSGNRESLDIINLILQVCLNGTMKTHIMYKCNLNSKQVQEYLEFLLALHVIERIDSATSRSVYQTTEKGKRLIRAYTELFDIFEQLNEGDDIDALHRKG